MTHRYASWLFLRLLGLCFFTAFLSLGVQVSGLIGESGLLPLGEFLAAVRSHLGVLERFWQVPTLFWAASGDGALKIGIGAGLLLSLALLLDAAPRYATLALWVLYLSFANACRDFLSFQWDNLLLESAFLAIFLAPGHVLPGATARARGQAPQAILVFLFRWLLFRLIFESGASKLLSGDPAWRDLTALGTYFETAPLPTWMGWCAHQLPFPWLRALTLISLAFETVAPFAIFGPRQARAPFFFANAAFQIATLLTANYGFFNYLALALSVFLFDDRDLSCFDRLVGRLGRSTAASTVEATREGRRRWVVPAALAVFIVPISVIEFARMWVPEARLPQPFKAMAEAVAPFRSINRYHLFASMTLTRIEVEIQGTADETTWEVYEFRYKPGDPRRAPPFVSPHQPRVDFQLWFLTLRGTSEVPAYFARLLAGLCTDPERMARFFARDPFPHAPPRAVRVALYRYRMSSRADRERDGVWWTREPMGYLGTLRCTAE